MNQESYRKKLLGPTYKAVLPPAWDTATLAGQAHAAGTAYHAVAPMAGTVYADRL